MKKENRKYKKHEKQITKIYFILGGSLIAILLGLIIYSAGLFEPEHEITKVEVLDECSLIMGNLIHNIRDLGDCKIKCNDNCEIRGLEFHDSEFVFQNSSCHTCDCYCK